MSLLDHKLLEPAVEVWAVCPICNLRLVILIPTSGGPEDDETAVAELQSAARRHMKEEHSDEVTASG